MANRMYMLRLSILSCLSMVSLFLFSFSCEDHVVPANPVPAQIKTLDVVRSLTATNLGVQFENLGNIPIAVYGIVYVPNSLIATPDINGAPSLILPIASPADLDPKFRTGPTLNFGPGVSSITFSYRAYALLNNGTVVYGEVKNVAFTPD
jgi:hypothetical protein